MSHTEGGSVMTRKDFELVAKLLNTFVRDKNVRAVLFIEFGNFFSNKYKNFDRMKWHDAVDLSG